MVPPNPAPTTYQPPMPLPNVVQPVAAYGQPVAAPGMPTTGPNGTNGNRGFVMSTPQLGDPVEPVMIIKPVTQPKATEGRPWKALDLR
jgi:hypothetical protein